MLFRCIVSLYTELNCNRTRKFPCSVMSPPITVVQQDKSPASGNIILREFDAGGEWQLRTYHAKLDAKTVEAELKSDLFM
jgi:hypothetical protein